MSDGPAHEEEPLPSESRTTPTEARRRLGDLLHSRQIDALEPPARLTRLDLKEHEGRIDLQKKYGYGLLGALLLQILVVHIIFVVFASENDWAVADNVFIAYLATTLGETVGLAAVVVRYLFPDRGRRRE